VLEVEYPFAGVVGSVKDNKKDPGSSKLVIGSPLGELLLDLGFPKRSVTSVLILSGVTEFTGPILDDKNPNPFIRLSIRRLLISPDIILVFVCEISATKTSSITWV
jgi:hypothetical protein